MKNKKLILLSILVCSFLFISVLIPSLAKLVTSKNYAFNEWDGSIASSFNSGNGTIGSPYIISNASEFAYFKESLKKNDYDNKYIKITNDIILNSGFFKVDDNLKYIKDDITYYLDSTTNKYYEDSVFTKSVGSINEFEMLNEFNGTLDGGNHTIYGLFIKGDNSSLFDSIGGTISNLIIENAYLYGEYNSSGLAFNSNGATINNVVVEGNILSNVGTDINSDENSISAGIIINANDSNIENVVNRAYVNNKIASGLVGIIKNTNISKSYNIGNINGDISSGIANTIDSSASSLSYVYNEGILNNDSSGLVSNIINSNVNIDHSYNSYNTYALGENENSIISITNSYNKISQEDFLTYNKDVIKEMFDNEYFIYDDMPLIELDYENLKYVNIVLKDNNWNTFKEDINYVSYDEDLSLILTSTKDYKAIKDVYYYLSEDELTKSDLENINWISYENPIGLKNKGTYILYAKVVNYNDDVYYLNTDRIYLYVDNIYASIQVDDYNWDNLHDTDYLFVKSKSFEIKAYSKNDIKSVDYLVTNHILNLDELENDNSWINYKKPVNITNDSIVYVKVEDNNSNVIYINSDHFIDTKYELTNVKSGNNLKFNSEMTYNSSISFNVELDNSNFSLDGFTRSIVSNESLPINTHIILNDLSENKVYEYLVDDSTNNEILLNKFREVGLSSDVFYTNKNSNKEKFNLIIDFKNIEETNKEFSIYFKAKKDNGELTSDPIYFKLNSLTDDINSNLHVTNSGYISLIKYNSLSTTNIYFNTSFDNKYLNTSLEDLDKVLIIEVIDSNNNVVNKDNYKGLKFVYKNKTYTPDNSNKTIIKLDDLNNIKDILTIKTSEDISGLLDESSTLKITLGLTFNNVIKYQSNNSINIPIVINKRINNYSFGVSVNKRLVNTNELFIFNINSTINNPNIKVYLYKKKERNGSNQEYTEVNISDYINESIEDIQNGENQISFKDGVEKNSYMFKFDLYNEDTYIGENSIKVVVR